MTEQHLDPVSEPHHVDQRGGSSSSSTRTAASAHDPQKRPSRRHAVIGHMLMEGTES
jgi:hypothetical protein